MGTACRHTDDSAFADAALADTKNPEAGGGAVGADGHNAPDEDCVGAAEPIGLGGRNAGRAGGRGRERQRGDGQEEDASRHGRTT